MRVFKFEDDYTMAMRALTMVQEELKKNPALLLCAATGNSPLPLYNKMALESEKNRALYEHIRVMALDEWIGLDASEGSCDAYLRKHLVEPLGISEERYFRFNVNAQNLNQECSHLQQQLNRVGPIDLCILGLGTNGHLGFNEPADSLQSHCHIAQLTPESRNHAMLKGATTTPAKGLTLGMKDILSSKRILMIISGKGKEKVKKAFFTEKVDPQLPASYLWQHNNVDCLVVQPPNLPNPKI